MSEGGTKKNRLESLEQTLKDEIKNWEALGISPQNFQGDQFYMHVVGITLFRVLKDMLNQDEDAMNILLKEVMLEELTKMRETLEPQIRQARLAALQQAIVPQIIPPWQKGNGGKG